MPVITALTRQKHEKTRVSVFVDGEYAFSLSDELVVTGGLVLGGNVNDADLEGLMDEDEYKRGLSLAMRHLSCADKTEKQMRDFLRGKEISPKNVTRVLARLKELNYLDDEAYARRFVSSAEKSGEKLVRAKLLSRGISPELADEILSESAPEDEEEKARKLGEKEWARQAGKPDRDRRTAAYLTRRGFSWDVIETLVNEWKENEE